MTRLGRFILISGLFVGCLFMAGCSVSFHSNQLERLRGFFEEEEDPYADSRWLADWNGQQIGLYAINSAEGTVFANQAGMQLHFDGLGITQALGLLGAGEELKILRQDTELLFMMNDRLLARHSCQPWNSSTQPSGALSYEQSCEGREAYSNRIEVDAEGNIIRLEFLVHPEYPSLRLMPAR